MSFLQKGSTLSMLSRQRHCWPLRPGGRMSNPQQQRAPHHPWPEAAHSGAKPRPSPWGPWGTSAVPGLGWRSLLPACPGVRDYLFQTKALKRKSLDCRDVPGSSFPHCPSSNSASLGSAGRQCEDSDHSLWPKKQPPYASLHQPVHWT